MNKALHGQKRHWLTLIGMELLGRGWEKVEVCEEQKRLGRLSLAEIKMEWTYMQQERKA